MKGTAARIIANLASLLIDFVFVLVSVHMLTTMMAHVTSVLLFAPYLCQKQMYMYHKFSQTQTQSVTLYQIGLMKIILLMVCLTLIRI